MESVCHKNQPYVICMGRPFLDAFYELDRLPQMGTKVNTRPMGRVCGGGMANSADVLAALGTQCYLLCAMGDDANTKFLLDSVGAFGVKTEYVQLYPGEENPINEILLLGGERLILMPIRETPLLITPDEKTMELLLGAEYIYTDMQNMMYLQEYEDFVPEYLQQGGKLFFDAEPSAIPDYRGAWPYLEKCAVLSFNETAYETAVAHMGKEAVEKLQDDPNNIFLMTLGSRGVAVYHGGTCTKIDGVKVPTVDTTGAGDTFNAAFLHKLMQGATPKESAEFACKAAAYCVTQLGATAAAVDEETILRAMRGDHI